MSKTSKLLAVSALALAAGFFGTTQLQAGQVLPGDIIIAQGAGSGGAGAGGSAGSGSESGSGNQLGDRPGTQQPVPVPGATRAPSTQTEPSPSASVPPRCASMTDAAQRADCIRRDSAQQGAKPGASPNR
ncbi:MAG: hypothetical protein K0Q70_313 [Rhodospirillales bacterium]|jgi:hypothetical protein|nr:hypothetical protein [Rhodospirillales bacterium]